MSKLKTKAPVEGKRNILIMSALPYSNATPHLGNLIGCVLSADVYSRFAKNRGYNTLYICGTDEYGTATEFKALENNCTPKEICDKYYEIHKRIYKWFEIDFDFFGRTSTSKQTEITTEIFRNLDSNGYIEERVTRQHYCGDCNRFLADRFLVGTCPKCGSGTARGDQCDACGNIYEAEELGNPRCKRCGTPSVEKDSKDCFLLLSKLEKPLSEWVEKSRGNWSPSAYKTSKVWLSNLQDRCITRSLSWGTPVPKEGFEDKVFYVWFDAPIGYISITAKATDAWEKWWKSPGVELVQFMGKDNITFHTLIFPGTLMGSKLNYNLVNRISATQHLLYQGGKFSKSEGRGVFGDEAVGTGLPASVWRYYLLVNRPETSDTDFKWQDLIHKTNGELNNSLGNLLHRLLTFTKSRFSGAVPSIKNLRKIDRDFSENINKHYREFIKEMESINLKSGLRTAMKVADLANNYFHSKEPWTAIKGSEEEKESCKVTINVTFQVLWLLSGLLEPFMPSVSTSMCAQLNMARFSLEKEDFDISSEFDGHKIGTPKVLFEVITEKRSAELEEQFSGAKTFSFPVDLVVGTVFSIEKHPSDESLWILTVQLGGKFNRKIVSDLGKFYSEDELKGKKVVVINNVKKFKVKGVSSYGMILCAGTKVRDGEIKKIATVDAPDGTKIFPKNIKNTKAEKKFNYKQKWSSLKMNVDENSRCRVGAVELVAEDGGEEKFLKVEGNLQNCDMF